ncbi:MAG: hypothetical protein GF346_02015, partial [Candidatus Eisenbacteria bacterium]|nr:hypothetical protein [Candidatus Eisenbacteria bacterium]
MSGSFLLLAAALGAAEPVGPDTRVIVVVGVGGEAEYAQAFSEWADRWEAAAESGGASFTRIGGEGPAARGDGEADGEADRRELASLLAEEPKTGAAPLWLVLLGHGTFDGREAKFNLRGRDVSAAELAAWLEPFERTQVIVNCASSSAPFINRLSRTGRVIVTATKSGYELNYARFGDYLSRAIAEPAADLDRDEQVSILEAFLVASGRVAEFYEEETRLATETALIDDN